MNCQTCQESLLELAGGTLGGSAADDARAHLNECESCRGAYAKLNAGLKFAAALPIEPVPSGLSARLRAQAAEHARAARAPRAAHGERPPAWRAAIEFVSRFAMARQVGMVTISLLIVAVGLWSLPQLRERGVVPSGATVVSRESSSTAAPVDSVAPQRADLNKDEARAASASQAEPAARDEPADKSAVGLSLRKPSADSARLAAAEVPAKRRAASARNDPSSGIGALATGGAVQSASGGAAKARVRGLGSRVPGSGENADDNAPLMGLDLRETASSAQPLARARAKGEGESATSPAPAAAPAAPVAPLTAARALEAQRGCSAALPAYQRIIANAPDSADAGAALIEIAACRRAAGDIPGARTLLERAARIAAVTSRAQQLLRQLPEAKPPAMPEPAAASAAEGAP